MEKVKRVRLISDPTQVGFLTGRDQVRMGRRLLQIQFMDNLSWKPESQLEYIDNIRLSPLDMLESKKLGRPIDFRRTLTHVKLNGALADVLYSMEATNTDFYAYQFKPVLKILESPANGILIADEVGLGKTIEAGLVWTELKSRFDMRRLMVLCPAALREKWQRELLSKFGVKSEICNAQEALNILSSDDLQASGFAIISSIQGLRPPSGWNTDDTIKSGSKKLATFLQSKENEEHLIDLLVIDEAHHLRNSETKTHEIGQLCRDVSEHIVLLTATPVHNKSKDLFSLLQLLDPDTFSYPDTFERILAANAPLIKARDLILGSGGTAQKLIEYLQQAKQHPLLSFNRQLSMLLEENITDNHLLNLEFRSHLAYRLENVNLLGHVVTRTRKKDVTEWRVIREPNPEFVYLTSIEKKFYDLVTEVVVKYAMQKDVNERFLLAQPQRQMTSSMAACLRSWQNKLVEIEEFEELDDSDNNENKKQLIGPLVTEIVLRSRAFVELNDLIRSDSKYARLRDILTDFLNDHPKEKVVVFSSFRATLNYLSERLEADGISNIVLMGGQVQTKDETVMQFSRPDGPNVLLSSEVGGEGIDLQFSRVVVNYDLPWNPMRVEQRIGRIDRLGQNAAKVIIWNILLAHTIDSRIYMRLYDKLNLCQNALGDFDAILGDKIRKLEIDLLSGHLTPEQQEKRIEQTAQALENLKLSEFQLEEEASNLVAYGDYILNQVKAARELHRWISSEDIYRYISDYITLHYPGCILRTLSTDHSIFEIELSDQAKFDLLDYIRKNKIPTSTRLTTHNSNLVKCKFDSRILGQSVKEVEYISQVHPLVKMIKHKLQNEGEQMTPAVSISLAAKDLEFEIKSGVYVIAIVHWIFKGLQSSERLIYVGSQLEKGGYLLDSIDAERLANAAISKGMDWLGAQNTTNLNLAYELASNSLHGELFEKYEVFINELTAKNEDRADIQLHNLNQHSTNQLLKLTEIKEKHLALGRESLAKATEGRIQAMAKRVELQRLRINDGRKTIHSSNEIAIALISIND